MRVKGENDIADMIVEKALHLTNIRNLRYFQKGVHQRIYWGAEFCQNLIPTIQDTEKILAFINRGNLKFTFVTPFVTEQGLNKLEKAFTWFKKIRLFPEIVVNDWGVLECLESEFKGYFEIALGRLLVRQQRDPAIKKVIEKQLPFAVRGKDGKIRIVVHRVPGLSFQQGIKASYASSGLAQGVFSRFGIKRVELNNVMQGLNLQGLKLKRSLYTPFVNISTTRFCPMESRFQKVNRINVCKMECQRYYDILRNRAVSKVVYKRGNTTFYKNPIKMQILANLTRMGANIDRIVFQPELPF